MPGAQWFSGARLNYAEHALRAADKRAEAVALLFAGEEQPMNTMSWQELQHQTACIAQALRDAGIRQGDCVAAILPNIPAAIVAFLAVTSLGAIWSSCSPEFGSQTVLDRFSQIKPKLLISVDGYRYGGKGFDRSDEIKRILYGLPSVQRTIFLPHLNPQAPPPCSNALLWQDLINLPQTPQLQFAQVSFDHPLWVVYSSGTTGLPKAIVHGHGGIILEMNKMLRLHCDLRPDSRMLFYTSTGWIMWNILVSALLVEAVPVLYDGHPSAPQLDVLWQLASESQAQLFGASPTYLAMMESNHIVPKQRYGLDQLQGILLTGSPATPESMAWLYDNVKADLWVTSQSGGTDVASGFVSGSCVLPVYAGEIQARALAVDARAYNDAGDCVVGEVGELVITQPMPSMPIKFWNDAGDARYKSSYFDNWPGVWRHGDFFELNERGGCYIRGRSDSTLNRYGVRIGTAEIYRCVEALPDIEDSLVVNLDLPQGRFLMPLFVQLQPSSRLDETLMQKIKTQLKTQCSPRHVPDEIIAVQDIPYTLTGKKLEVPVRKILLGADPDKAASCDAMKNPAALEEYIAMAGQFS